MVIKAALNASFKKTTQDCEELKEKLNSRSSHTRAHRKPLISGIFLVRQSGAMPSININKITEMVNCYTGLVSHDQ